MRSARLSFARTSVLVAIGAALTIVACSDSRDASSLTGLRPVAGVGNLRDPSDLGPQIGTLIGDLFRRRHEAEVRDRWRDIKDKVRNERPAARKRLVNLVEWLQRHTDDVTPPEGETAEHAVARLVLLMSVFVYEGPDAEPPVLGATTDAALALVQPGEAMTLQTPNRHAGVMFPQGAVSVPTLVIFAKNELPYVEVCSGPLPTALCQYPGAYRLDVFPDVRLNEAATVAVCREGGAPTDPSRLRLAHQRPADSAANHPQGTISGDIEVLPAAEAGTLVECEQPVGGTVFMFSEFVPVDPESGDRPGPPNHLQITSDVARPNAGESFALTVELRDNQDRRTTTTAGVHLEVIFCPFFSCTSSDHPPQLVQTLHAGAENGVASFAPVVLSRAGGYLFSATALEDLSGGLFLFVQSGAAAALAIVEGNLQTATVGTAVAIVPEVAIVDVYGNIVNTETPAVRFSIAGGGGAIGEALLELNFHWTWSPRSWVLGPVPGTNTLVASADGLNDVVFVATGIPPAFRAASISAGWDFTCAISGSAGSENFPYCWGDNTFSQLGDGTQSARNRPTLVAPSMVQAGLLRMTQVTGGQQFACGLTPNGAAACWGSNISGQLGIDAQDMEQHTTPEAVLGGHTFTQISAGFLHVCALDTDGIGWCWGDGSIGQLGVGVDRTGFTHPLRVAAGETIGEVNRVVHFTQIDVGGNTSCGVSTDGDIWCWGSDIGGMFFSRFGVGWSFLPVRVTSGRVYSEVSVSVSHACAISAGSVYCWGGNSFGQLGTGTNAPSDVPVPALGVLGSARHVSAGGRHTCVVTGVGEIYCWGDNSNGQLGDGTMTQRNSGVRAQTDGLFTSLATGLVHTCAERQNGGDVYCWGSNGSGRLGIGISAGVNRTTPVVVLQPLPPPPPPTP